MGRKGTKDKKAARNKQRKALAKLRKRKATVKAKNIRRNLPKSSFNFDDMTKMVIKQFEDSGEATWWVANGVNYLRSDYDEGVWSPVFPEIYEDGYEITIETIKGYLTQHFNPEDNSWTAEGRRAIGMVMSPVEAVYAIATKCIDVANAADLDPKSPKCDPVWQVFNLFKQELDSRLEDRHLDSSETTENSTETSNPNEAIQS